MSLMAQMVKNMPAIQETWVQFQGQEDPLEKGMATYSSILAWTIPWTEETGGLQFMGSQRLDTTNTFQQENIKFVNIYVSNTGAPKNIKLSEI